MQELLKLILGGSLGEDRVLATQIDRVHLLKQALEKNAFKLLGRFTQSRVHRMRSRRSSNG